MNVNQLSDTVCAAPQLQPEQLASIAEAGFKSIINNRPDMEGGADQPTSAQIEAAAKAAGLSYAYLPVVPGQQTPAQIAECAKLLQTLPQPVLMFCRSGARSTQLYYQAQEV